LPAGWHSHPALKILICGCIRYDYKGCFNQLVLLFFFVYGSFADRLELAARCFVVPLVHVLSRWKRNRKRKIKLRRLGLKPSPDES
jgi:hypothetical protein